MEFRSQQEEDTGVPVSSGFSPPPIRISAFSKPTLSPTSSLLFSPGAGGIGGGSRNGNFFETRSATPADPTTTTNTKDHPPNSQGVDSDLAPVSITSPGATAGISSGGGGGGGGGVGSNLRVTITTPTTTTTNVAAATTPTAAAKYRECLRNHAASVGGHVVDGCGEFMPGGDTGTPDAMKCAACGCHRSFHRKESDAEPASTSHYLFNNGTPHSSRSGSGACNRIPILLSPYPRHHQKPLTFPPSPSAGIASGGNHSGSGGTPTESSSEELHAGGVGAEVAGAASSQRPAADGVRKKRFRTKFTAEQKEKMRGFAERVGWRIHRQDEAAVEQFCVEVGIRRQVLKVWMHNNKHTLRKHQPSLQQPQQQEQQQQQQ